MSKSFFVKSVAAGMVGASLLLAGCVISPPHVSVTPGYVGMATVEPPPPQAEYPPPAPYPGWIWLGGFWNWSGGRYVWERGHYEAPRPGHMWVGHRWERRGNGWVLNRGHWDRR